jgi:hypothetical protein
MSRQRKPRFPPQEKLTPTGGKAFQCCAKKRGTDERCGAKALKNSNYCRIHDGAPQFSADNHRWRGGTSKPRYDGPPILNKDMRAALRDPKLLEQHDEIALITARTRQLVKRLGSTDPIAFASAADALFAAVAKRDTSTIRMAMTQLHDLRNGAREDDATWRAIFRAIDRLRKLKESQRKRIRELDLVVEKAQVLRFGQALMEAVTSQIDDADTLKRIAERFRFILGDLGDEAGTVH